MEIVNGQKILIFVLCQSEKVFEIKSEQKELVHCKKELVHNKKLTAKHPKDAISKNDGHLSEDNETNTIKAIRDYQQSLNIMSPEQLLQPAYTNTYFVIQKIKTWFGRINYQQLQALIK
jgi:hypothetical protein